MGPKRIVESEISELVRFVGTKNSGRGSDHLDAQLAVQVFLPLVERPYSDANLHAHPNII